MAQDLEQLVLTISADVRQMQRALKRMESDTASSTRKVQNHFDKMGKGIDRSLSRSFSTIGSTLRSGLAAFGVGIGVRELQGLVDAATRIENALKVAGLSGEELTRVYDKLFASAQRNAAPLETLVTLYGRAALVQKELGVSSDELIRFTDNVALALRVAGSDAQSASGALLQLSQALGSGVVRAEEFNSILEGAPTIAQAAAAGLEEAGGSVAKLRQLVIDGEVSSQAFFRAFEAGAAILQDKVAGSALTVSQGFTKLQNTLIDAAGRLDEVTGASSEAAALLDRLAGVVNGLANVAEAAANGPLGRLAGVLNDISNAIKTVLPGINALNLLEEDTLNAIADRVGPAAGPETVTTAPGKQGRVDPEQRRIQSRIDDAFGTAPRTVSLKDFAVPDDGKGGKGGSKRESDFAREKRQFEERIAAIRAETEAMAGLNPLVNDYGFALAKARAEQELLAAAQKEGLAITPELRASISELAGSYAEAEAAAEQLAESQDRVVEMAESFDELGKDVLGGFISDLREGKTAAEALSNALGKVADKLIDMALDSLFSPAGGVGILGKLFAGVFHSGGVVGQGGPKRAVSPLAFVGAPRMHDGGIAGLKPGEVPAILQRGEVVLRKGARAGAAGSETINVVLRDDSGRMAEIADQTFQTRAGSLVRVSVQQSQKATQKALPGMMANAQLRDF